MKKTHTCAALLCLVGTNLHAQNELPAISTVAHRMETNLSDYGSSLSIFDSDEIQLMGSPFVQDVLRWAPGMNITRTGGPGQLSQLYLRGTESRHTLILVDGQEIRNSNSPNGYDLVHLPTGNIERIEVLRGPQSPLYGADALGGVINIITQKGDGQSSGTISFAGGTHDTWTGNLTANGQQDKLSYSLHASVFESDSFSVARAGSEDDPYENRNTSLTLGYALSENANLQFTARRIDTETLSDNAATADAAGYRSNQEDSTFRLSLDQGNGEGSWKNKLAYSYKDFDQDNLSFGTEYFTSQSHKAEFQHTREIGDSTTLLGGIEYLEEKGEQDLDYGFGLTQIRDTLKTTSGFLQARHSFNESFTLDLGGRLDDSQTWGSEATWRASANYWLGQNTRLKGSVGTGYFAPNVYYLANAQDRNTLEPEESTGIDIGIEQLFLDGKFTLGVTFFDNDIENLFGWNGNFRVVNIDNATTQGVETSLTYAISNNWRLHADWTYMDTEDLSTHQPLDFRPENQVGARLFWTPQGQKFSAFLGVRHRSMLYNSTFSTNTAQNPSPSGETWEASVRYQVTGNASVFLRAEDLFDQELEEMRDFNGTPYAVPGQTFLAGINWKF